MAIGDPFTWGAYQGGGAATRQTNSNGDDAKPPAQNERTSFADLPTTNEVGKKSEPRQYTISGPGKPVPVIYGMQRCGNLMALKSTQNAAGDLFLRGIISIGEIESVSQFEIEDKPPPAGCAFTVYTGAAGQGVDPTLAAQLPGYADKLPGIAYFVAVISAAALATIKQYPRVTCLVRGLKIYDPRDPTQVLGNRATYKYSDNPSLICADFQTGQFAYGLGETLDWASVAACADLDDRAVGTPPFAEKARQCAFSLFEKADSDKIADTLATYAHLWAERDGAITRFIPNAPRAPIYALTNTNVLEWKYCRMEGHEAVPTEVKVYYTDTSKTPWAKDFAVARAPQFYNGGVRVTREVNLPGISRYSEAKREAIHQLNTLMLSSLRVGALVADEGVRLQKGDLVTVSLWPGIANKVMVTDKVEMTETLGNWVVHLSEYDPAFFTDVVQPIPTTPDTGDLHCGVMPPITGLVLTQAPRFVSGVCTQALKAQWYHAPFPCLATFAWRLHDFNGVVASGETGYGVFDFPNAVIGGVYMLQVRMLSLDTTQAPGPWTDSNSVTITAQACPPEPPAAVWVLGEACVKKLGAGAAAVTVAAQSRAIHLDPPSAPITATELYFDYGTGPILIDSQPGFNATWTWWRGNDVLDSGSVRRDAATLVVGAAPAIPNGAPAAQFSAPGSSPTGGYAGAYAYTGPAGDWVCPIAVSVRFLNGAIASDFVTVGLSAPQVFLTLQPHAAPNAATVRCARMFDGSLFCPVVSTNAGQTVRTFLTNQPTVFDTVQAIAPIVNIAWAGGLNHTAFGRAQDAVGNSIDGRVEWLAMATDAAI